MQKRKERTKGRTIRLKGEGRRTTGVAERRMTGRMGDMGKLSKETDGKEGSRRM